VSSSLNLLGEVAERSEVGGGFSLLSRPLHEGLGPNCCTSLGCTSLAEFPVAGDDHGP
jgi:hypothetical protein